MKLPFHSFQDEIDELVLVERAGRTELFSRLGIAGVQTVIIGYVLELWLLYPIYVIYAGCLLAGRQLIFRLENNRTVSLYITALMVMFAGALCFRMVSIYFWVQPQPQLDVVAVLMICASMMFTFSQRTAVPSSCYIEIGSDTIAMLFFASTLVFQPDPSLFDKVGALAFVGIILYNWVVIAELFASRQAFKAARERSLQAQKMEAVGRLTGGVAHDFNNILTVVMGNLELYREVDNGADREALVDQAHAAAKRASQLTAQLLAFSRQSPMTLSQVDLHEFVGSFRTLTDRVLPATITFNVGIDDRCPPLLVDKVQLEVALLNLVINSRDALSGGGTITLTAQVAQSGPPLGTAMRHDGQFVRLSITDDGEGIAPEIVAKVTEPFFTTKNVGDGSGLGLPMVQGFAEQSGGLFSLESQLGRGTMASLLLPAADLDDVAQDGAFPPPPH